MGHPLVGETREGGPPAVERPSSNAIFGVCLSRFRGAQKPLKHTSGFLSCRVSVNLVAFESCCCHQVFPLGRVDGRVAHSSETGDAFSAGTFPHWHDLVRLLRTTWALLGDPHYPAKSLALDTILSSPARGQGGPVGSLGVTGPV